MCNFYYGIHNGEATRNTKPKPTVEATIRGNDRIFYERIFSRFPGFYRKKRAYENDKR